jgi:peptidoglycan hydrolase CwlO-like protein
VEYAEIAKLIKTRMAEIKEMDSKVAKAKEEMDKIKAEIDALNKA